MSPAFPPEGAVLVVPRKRKFGFELEIVPGFTSSLAVGEAVPAPIDPLTANPLAGEFCAAE